MNNVKVTEKKLERNFASSVAAERKHGWTWRLWVIEREQFNSTRVTNMLQVDLPLSLVESELSTTMASDTSSILHTGGKCIYTSVWILFMTPFHIKNVYCNGVFDLTKKKAHLHHPPREVLVKRIRYIIESNENGCWWVHLVRMEEVVLLAGGYLTVTVNEKWTNRVKAVQ